MMMMMITSYPETLTRDRNISISKTMANYYTKYLLQILNTYIYIHAKDIMYMLAVVSVAVVLYI